MEIREGYKKTEVGVIPNDWESYLTENIIEKNAKSIKIGPFGSQLKKEVLSLSGPFKVYGQENVYKNDFDIGDRYLSKEKYCELQSCELHSGDIVISMMGTIGKCAIVPKKLKAGIMDSHLLKLKIDTKNVIPEYVKNIIESDIIQQQMINLSVGGIMSGLSSNIIKQLFFPIPPLQEQQAIATALSDIDGLINSLTKLIDKKKNIKQGAMQELLTGKKRIEGFSGEWREKTVEEFGEITTGSTPPTSTPEYWNGKIPWITPTDIKENKNVIKSEREITKQGLNVLRQLKANTVLITCIASLGKNAILRIEGACNQQINAISPNKDYNADFIYYLFEINKQYLLSNAGITATNIVSKTVFSTMIFKVPLILEEQTAIANILSDMDNEIEVLEQKLNKYKDIKQGMMQELLTGRIRLVEGVVQ